MIEEKTMKKTLGKNDDNKKNINGKTKKTMIRKENPIIRQSLRKTDDRYWLHLRSRK